MWTVILCCFPEERQHERRCPEKGIARGLHRAVQKHEGPSSPQTFRVGDTVLCTQRGLPEPKGDQGAVLAVLIT